MYTIEKCKQRANKIRITWAVLVGIISHLTIMGMILAIYNFINTDNKSSILLFYLCAVIFAIVVGIGINTLIQVKVSEFEYKGHSIVGYCGFNQHISFVDGKFKEEYGTIWWQHTFAYRIDDDQVCIKYGPIKTSFYVKEGYYKNK